MLSPSQQNINDSKKQKEREQAKREERERVRERDRSQEGELANDQRLFVFCSPLSQQYVTSQHRIPRKFLHYPLSV